MGGEQKSGHFYMFCIYVMLESSVQENRRDGQVVFEDSVFAGYLQDELHSLRLEDSLTDVSLHVQGQSFPCHRVVLAAASHYFR
uniref:BTB domain-containing protein n=1 Tax=Sinocyclocheilus anshuiensis TaxID=1608454 RepID=A0A671KMT5_9TELE